MIQHKNKEKSIKKWAVSLFYVLFWQEASEDRTMGRCLLFSLGNDPTAIHKYHVGYEGEYPSTLLSGRSICL